MYQFFIKTALAVLISVCYLSHGTVALAQSPNVDPHQESSAKLTTSTPKSAPPSQNLSVLSFLSPAEGEPLLLLLFGLAVFLGATTIKRKKSNVRSDGDI